MAAVASLRSDPPMELFGDEMNYRTTITSPIGDLTLTSDGEAITEIWMGEADPLPGAKQDDSLPVFKLASEQFEAYFQRQRTDFDLPLKPYGTPFQLSV